ncbi:MAG: SAM-dependent methyltransferase [Polyangiaceae bacterium]
MREGKTSTTANVVSLLRALASLPDTPYRAGSDPVARELLPLPYSALLDAVARAPLLLGPVRLASLGLLDHIALRTAAIDREIELAAEAGLEQLVVLGAGLDARAFRLDALSRATVFEVDYPATHAFKRERSRSLEPRCRELRAVAVDFARDSLAERLAQAGHETERPTIWVWEGVTPYLPIPAIQSTLSVVGERSASGSVLCVTYITPELAAVPIVPHALMRLAFDIIGEPIEGILSEDQMTTLLGAAGFRVQRDTGSRAWAADFKRGRLSRIQILEQLAVAVRS